MLNAENLQTWFRCKSFLLQNFLFYLAQPLAMLSVQTVFANELICFIVNYFAYLPVTPVSPVKDIYHS